MRTSAPARQDPRWATGGAKPEPKITSLRGAELFRRVFKYPPCVKILHVNGLSLRVRSSHISPSAARELGIKPDLLRDGAKVYVVTREDYGKYCATIGADPDKVAGVYAPKGAREIQELMAAQREILSPEVRKVLIPEDADALTLCHEILHDLFNSWNAEDPRAERIAFSRLVVSLIYRVLSLAPQSPEAAFFRGAAARCEPPYDLSRITGAPIPRLLASRGGIIFTERTQAFLAEVFAYGASMAIYSEKGLGTLPTGLRAYFEGAVISGLS